MKDIQKEKDIFLNEIGNVKRVGVNTYRAICFNCGHKDCFTIYDKSDRIDFNCYSCNASGDLLNFIKQKYNYDTKTANKYLVDTYNYNFLENTKNNNTNAVTVTEEKNTKQNNVNLSERLFFLLSERNSAETITYAKKRNIDESLFVKKSIFVNNSNMLVIPILDKTCKNVLGIKYRYLNDNASNKYRYEKGSNKTLYNLSDVKDSVKNIVVTEGELDCLSIISCLSEEQKKDTTSIAICSAVNIDLIEDYIYKNKDKKYILALDNDKTGIDCREKLINNIRNKDSELLKNISILEIDSDLKDVNDMIVRDKNNLNNKIIEAINSNINDTITDDDKNIYDIITSSSASNYLQEDSFIQELDNISIFRDVDLGFKNFNNNINGLHPSLYVIGGISGVGKTTFTLSLLENIATLNKDIDVIFFSFEQSKIELFPKIASRRSFKDFINNSNNKAYSSTDIKDILLDKDNTEHSKVKDLLFNQSKIDNLYIIEADRTTTIEQIESYIKAYKKINKNKKLVIGIDYLQVIPCSIAISKKDIRERTDYNITVAKNISRKYDTPIFMISSLNRDSYKQTDKKIKFDVSLSSFKESGAIEYSADVILGIRFSKVKDTILEHYKGILDKNTNEYYREIEIDILKNRYGGNGSICFKYYHRYDYFIDLNQDLESIL